ncbi:MAG: ABC transporter substrate-binding protein [Hyphomicrobiales bacterium]|nr:ABC transporter substrate-binding protein [Nitratireductor sp.]MCC2096885.1 ABC transporter substrate-binding protein [Hyphomicrobiales bacterium]
MMSIDRISLVPLERPALAATLVVWLWFVMAPTAFGADESRIASIGGSVTEIVYALGEGNRLVARDTTSNYPPEILALPDIGYIRALSPEGVLSVDPDMILILEGFGPPEAAEVLRQAGVRIVEVPEGYDRNAVIGKIETVAAALGVEEKGRELSQTVRSGFDRMAEAVGNVKNRVKVMFVLSTAGGRIMAAGRDSHADGIIALAGATNAFDAFAGYKQVTEEAIADAAPDAILMMDRGGDHAVSAESLFAMPSFSQTPAAKNAMLIKMDGMYLLGFGPRTPNAARELASKLYPGIVEAPEGGRP